MSADTTVATTNTASVSKSLGAAIAIEDGFGNLVNTADPDVGNHYNPTDQEKAVALTKRMVAATVANPKNGDENFMTLKQKAEGPDRIKVVEEIIREQDSEGRVMTRKIRHTRYPASAPAGSLLYYQLSVEVKRGAVLTYQEKMRYEQLRAQFGDN